jgi:hypothetical protein
LSHLEGSWGCWKPRLHSWLRATRVAPPGALLKRKGVLGRAGALQLASCHMVSDCGREKQ